MKDWKTEVIVPLRGDIAEQLRRLLYKAARNDSGRIEIEITSHGVTICDHSEYLFEWDDKPDISGTTRVAPASSPD